MPLSLPPRKTYTHPPTSHTYSYIHIPPTPPTSPTLLLLHGFPSHIPDWHAQITAFTPPTNPYGILAIDLLGFGQSSCPPTPPSYTPTHQIASLHALLTHLSLLPTQNPATALIPIAHAPGATLPSRLAASHPIFPALIFLTTGPPKPTTRFDVSAINAATRAATGTALLGYIPYLADRGTVAERERRAARIMSVMFAAEQERVWERHFRPEGALRAFVESAEEEGDGEGDGRVEVAEWYGEELQEEHLRVFGREGRGYVGVCGWYGMMQEELFLEGEKGMEGVRLEVPTLLICEAGEGGKMQAGMLGEWATDLRVKECEAGHWVHLERSDFVNEEIGKFLAELGLC